jgi:hypothetical protein
MNFLIKATGAAKRIVTALTGISGRKTLTPIERARLDQMDSDYEELVRRRMSSEINPVKEKVQNKNGPQWS